MTVALAPEMEALVNERIARGQYTNPEEVVSAGPRLLRETELLAILDEAEQDARAGRVAPFDPLATAARVKAARAARAENKDRPVNNFPVSFVVTRFSGFDSCS